MNSQSGLEALSCSDLLARTRELVQSSRGIEAELLVHLGEIDERKLYLDCALPSMFAFCVGELGFSEDAAYNRITVARAARRLPAVIDAVRSGQVHLAGLRLLVPHLTGENHREVLAQAAGKSKREIEELVARFSPQPPLPDVVRKLPQRTASASAAPPSLPLVAAPALPVPPAVAVAPPAVAPEAQLPPPSRRDEHRPVIAPLSEETFKVQFTASRELRDKLRQAQDLLRHRVPDGDLATILDKALDLLIEEVKKERFATGRKARQASREDADDSSSRHIPDAIKRAVFERDDVDRIRLLCRAHNQHAAEQMYGRGFMERARAGWGSATRPGASSQSRLL